MKTTAIIGSGFSGMASASILAKNGIDVTVYEKNLLPGGRAQWFEEEGFSFDMGPSWYWMPDVFERFFSIFDRNVSDFYDLVRLDPSYQVLFNKDEYYSVPAFSDQLFELFDSLEKNSGNKLKLFLEDARYKYELGMKDFVYKQSNIRAFMKFSVLKEFLRLNLFTSMSSHVRKYFSDPRILQLLEFPVLFLGAKPAKTPALYSLMNYADLSLGTWYPKGGIRKVSEGFFKLAKEQGVKFEFNSNVEKIIPNDKKITLKVNGEHHVFDSAIGSADYHHIEQELLDKEYRKYDENYWDTRSMSPSSLIFYVGLNTKVPKLKHHNLFFDENFEQHFYSVYDNPKWPKAPLFYVCCPSKTDPTVSPEGFENLFILIPVASGLNDNDDEREKLFEKIWKRIEIFTGQSLKQNIILKKSYAHKDFVKDYNSFKGNAYGLANTLMQTAFLRPTQKSKKIKNFVYAGQLTIPGPGLPPAIISGELAAREILKIIKD